MKILGLDISSNLTGWAYLENDKVLDYGVFKTSGFGVDKLVSFYKELSNVIESHDKDIDWVGIEDTYIMNASLTKLLSRYCGVAVLSLGLTFGFAEILDCQDIKTIQDKISNPRSRYKPPERGIYMPTPNEIFGVLGIYLPKDRDKKKEEAIGWVKDNLYIELSREQDDIADALCIAFATKQTALKIRK